MGRSCATPDRLLTTATAGHQFQIFDYVKKPRVEADKLRENIDGAEYKRLVLGLIFVN